MLGILEDNLSTNIDNIRKYTRNLSSMRRPSVGCREYEKTSCIRIR